MSAPPGRPTWAEIDLQALLDNYRALNSLLRAPKDPGSEVLNGAPRLIPVIKANAYGHGASQVARTLAAEGASIFAVAIVEEAVALRDSGFGGEILVLEGAWPGQESETARLNLTPAVHSVDGVRRLDEAAGNPLAVHVKVDTGMGRLGVPWERPAPVLEALRNSRHLRVAGTFSHLACAEEEDRVFAREQLRRFRHTLAQFAAAGLAAGELHLANSAGLLYHPELSEWSARPGIALYGYAPDPSRSPVPLKPVLTLKCRIGRLHTIPAGETVGYGRAFRAERLTRTATLPIGYADGFRRNLSGAARVVIRDQAVPILGRVTMDMIVADVTDIAGVEEGDEVILLGTSPLDAQDASVWSRLLDTIPYEILCGISARVPRVYLRKD